MKLCTAYVGIFSEDCAYVKLLYKGKLAIKKKDIDKTIEKAKFNAGCRVQSESRVAESCDTVLE